MCAAGRRAEGGSPTSEPDVTERYEYTPYGRRTIYSNVCWMVEDMNDDGVVDGQEFTIYKAEMGTGPPESRADLNGDGIVDGQDFTIHKATFGNSLPSREDAVYHPRLESFRLDSDDDYVDCDVTALCDPPAWLVVARRAGVGHQGLLHDREFGLVYNRARYLSPTLCRFIQRDPIGYADGMSLYEYVRSCPTGRKDPLGLIFGCEPAPREQGPRIVVDQSLGQWGGAMALDDIEDYCEEATSYVCVNNLADEGDIMRHVRTYGCDDVWVYMGHIRKDESGNIVGIEEHDNFSRNDPVLQKDINAEMEKTPDSNPGLVVLAACRSCELAEDYLQRGTMCVICANAGCAPDISARMLKTFFEEYCKGKTVKEAFSGAKTAADAYQSKNIEIETCKWELKCRPKDKRNMKLAPVR